jgi:hypothetical protein
MSEENETPAKTTNRKAPAKQTVVQRILAVADEVGILTPEKSGGVPFAFRGVDAVVSKLTPLLNKHGVIVVPHDVTQILSQRDVGSKVVTKADVTATYRFYGADGDFIDATVVGQADDFADRSSAQAMSVAFRILLLQTFHIAAFGNEEQASEDTKNQRESAGSAKVNAAKASVAQSGPDPAEQMRSAILAAAGRKGWDGEEINKFAEKIGLGEGWFDDPDSLNTLLTKINGE